MKILLDSGSGGRASQRLIADVFLRHFDNGILRRMDDAALLDLKGPVAMSTDGYTVTPLFFPGGSIGSLAVHGTVNDVSMLGARPRYLSCAFIIEEGLELDVLERVVEDMARAAKKAGVDIVTGAAVLVSGSMGDHGLTVMARRDGLSFAGDASSDSAPLNRMVERLITEVGDIHVLRDPTRGGLATTLNEIAEQSGVGCVVEESAVPVHDSVRAGCDVLGLDPLYLANEGKLICIQPGEKAQAALEVMKSCEFGAEAAIIGSITAAEKPRVELRTFMGGSRLLSMLEGAQLPRIC